MSLAYEMQLSKKIIQLVEQHAKQAQATHVSRIELTVGALAGVEPEVLRFCFTCSAQNSMAQNAILDINTLSGTGWCNQCHETIKVSSPYEACPQCNSYQITFTDGKQVQVVSIDIV